MFLKIATTYKPATDLGYLLRKNPANEHRADLWFGESIIFFPVATPERCEAVLLLDVDPVTLVRGRHGAVGNSLLDHYVNDRPYAASSFLSVAMARTLRDAMAGRAPQRESLAEMSIPLEFTVTPLPCRGGEEIARNLFEPLGYGVETDTILLDAQHPEWGDSPYRTLRLTATLRLAEALNHLYVLIPVLDNRKHYWVGEDEIKKLIAKGGSWLQAHPERDLIANRYLRFHRYAERALALLDENAGLPSEEKPLDEGADEQELEKPLRLNERRYEAVIAALLEAGVRRVCDFGCGEGKLLTRMMKEKTFERIIGIDVSTVSLERAERRLKLDRMAPSQRARIDVYRGSLVYEDKRLSDVDAVILIEVIEHVDLERLEALERVVFAKARPETVILTTPNVEYNAAFEDLDSSRLRHHDHRFEWTRLEFADWAAHIRDDHGYNVEISGIGDVHAEYGAPTQMAVFRRRAP